MAHDLETRILHFIRTHGEVSIRKLADAFPAVHENTIRYHLRRLTEKELVRARRVGREMSYTAIEPEQPVPAFDSVEKAEMSEQPSLRTLKRRARRRDELASDADPLRRTVNFMRGHMRLAQTSRTLAKAREQLLQQNARELFYEFFKSLVRKAKSQSDIKTRRAGILALRSVCRTLGIGPDLVSLSLEDATVEWHPSQLHDHLSDRISEGTFLFEVKYREFPRDDGRLKVGGSDVSEHWDIINLPTAGDSLPIRVAFPMVLHNAAAVIKVGPRLQEMNNDQPWVTRFIPEEILRDLRRWMMIDPATLYELEDNRQKRLCLTSMDIGQYYIEVDTLLRGDYHPTLLFRDGRIFPSDCYAANAYRSDAQGGFVREAIQRMDNFLDQSVKQRVMVCGVAKTTATACFGPVVDWFIRERVDRTWPFEDPRPADTIWMTHLLSDGHFDGSFSETLVSCSVARTFRDTSDLRPERVGGGDAQHQAEQESIQKLKEKWDSFGDIFQRVLDTRVQMFFVGHSRHPDIRLPRYEYYVPSTSVDHRQQAAQMLRALQFVGLVADEDHDFMARETLRTLVPSVVFFAHDHSKSVGERLVTDLKQLVLSSLREAGTLAQEVHVPELR